MSQIENKKEEILEEEKLSVGQLSKSNSKSSDENEEVEEENENYEDNSEGSDSMQSEPEVTYVPSDCLCIFSYARHNRYDKLQEILNKGVHPDLRDEYGNTILIIAAQNNYKHIVKAAILKGADIDASNNIGCTALHYCSEYNYISLGDYLMQKGAKPFITNMYGYTAVQGVREDHQRTYEFLRYVTGTLGRKLS